MKIKTEQLLAINSALKICAQIQNNDPQICYVIAKNLGRLKKIDADFQEENNLRVNSFAKKDPITKEPITINGRYDFGENTEKANAIFKDLCNKEVEFEPYEIKRSEHTDKLPAMAQAELLDIIIKE